MFSVVFSRPDGTELIEEEGSRMFAYVSCLASIPGKEDLALEAFEKALCKHPEEPDHELATRGSMSRMLRRAGRVSGAEEHKQEAAYVPQNFLCTY